MRAETLHAFCDELEKVAISGETVARALAKRTQQALQAAGHKGGSLRDIPGSQKIIDKVVQRPGYLNYLRTFGPKRVDVGDLAMKELTRLGFRP